VEVGGITCRASQKHLPSWGLGVGEFSDKVGRNGGIYSHNRP